MHILKCYKHTCWLYSSNTHTHTYTAYVFLLRILLVQRWAESLCYCGGWWIVKTRGVPVTLTPRPPLKVRQQRATRAPERHLRRSQKDCHRGESPSPAREHPSCRPRGPSTRPHLLESPPNPREAAHHPRAPWSPKGDPPRVKSSKE